jgi:hypothetical protein
MMAPNSVSARTNETRSSANRAVSRRSLILAAVVAILVLGLALWFLSKFISGPSVVATISGHRIKAGNASGCIFYIVSLQSPSNALIHDLDATIQFPREIASYKFGTQSAEAASAKGESLAGLEVGKAADGDCEIVRAPLSPAPAFSTNLAGPAMIQIHGSRIPPKTSVAGVFVLSTPKPGFQPAAWSKEGFYEYKLPSFFWSKRTLFGAKRLEFIDRGSQDSE